MFKALRVIGDSVSVLDTDDGVVDLVSAGYIVRCISDGVEIDGCCYSPYGIYVTVDGDTREIQAQVWKPITGKALAYTGRDYYEVSNWGRVRSIEYYDDIGRYHRPRIITPVKADVAGGLSVKLRNKRSGFSMCKVHDLVANAFLKKPEKGMRVKHIDGNVSNNSVYNLSWGRGTIGRKSARENFSSDSGLKGCRRDIDVNKSIRQYKMNGILIDTFRSIQSVSNRGKWDINRIWDCCIGESNTSYGYVWRFKGEPFARVKKSETTAQLERTVKSVDAHTFVSATVRGNEFDTFWMRNLPGSIVEIEDRPVRKYSKTGEFICEYSSMDCIGLSYGDVLRVEMCCNRKAGFGVVNGYKWRYAYDDEFDIVSIAADAAEKRPVIQCKPKVLCAPKNDLVFEGLVIDGEIWRPVSERYGKATSKLPKYEVSNLGRVRGRMHDSGTEQLRLKNTYVDRRGSISVNLKTVVAVHRLVAEAFIPNPFGARSVIHLDGNKQNNNASNLAWQVPKKSQVKAVRGKEVRQYTLYGELIAIHSSAQLASKVSGLSYTSISRCCRREDRYQQVGGFIWRYSDDDEVVELGGPLDYKIVELYSNTIVQYKLDGSKVSEYKSIAEAERVTGVSYGSIAICCRGKGHTAGGFVWRCVGDAFSIGTDNSLDGEIWKPISIVDIKTSDGRSKYEVSSFGRVRSTWFMSSSGKFIDFHTLSVVNNSVRLYRDPSTVSILVLDILVATMFVPNPRNFGVVFHLDGDVSNCRADNLVWVEDESIGIDDLIKNDTGEIDSQTQDTSDDISTSFCRNGRPVRQYSLSGKFIRQFESIASAARSVNCTKSNIMVACIGGVVTARNFMWRYADFDDLAVSPRTSEEILAARKEQFKTKEEWYNPDRFVRQYDTDGKLVAIHKTTGQAAKAVGGSKTSIKSCCRRSDKSSKGYVWRWAIDDELFDLSEEGRAILIKSFNIQPKKWGRIVRKYTLNHEFVEEFGSITEAMNSIDSGKKGVFMCCSRIKGHASAGGFIWRYADDDEFNRR